MKSIKELVHVHIPKTGGSWVNRVLKEYCAENFVYGDHGGIDPWADIAWDQGTRAVVNGLDVGVRHTLHFKEPHTNTHRFEKATKIAVVRNPFSMLVSMYSHEEPLTSELGAHFKDHPIRFRDVPTGWHCLNLAYGIRSFKHFVYRWCDEKLPCVQDRLRKFLFYQLFNQEGKPEVDIVIRNEYLTSALPQFLQSYGYISQEQYDSIMRIPRVNVSPATRNECWRTYYTDELREMIEEKCSHELNMFGYNFDGPTSCQNALWNDAFIDVTGMVYPV